MSPKAVPTLIVTLLLAAAAIAPAAAAAPRAAGPANPRAAGPAIQRAAVGPAASLTPHLLLIHGGSFLSVDPGFQLLTEPPALAAGFVPHYLAYPLGDLPAAVRAARAEARELRRRYGGAVYAYGSSAGGTLAAILAGDGLVAGAVAKAPPVDLPTWSWPLGVIGPDYPAMISSAEPDLRRLSPLRRPARRPLLVVHGETDAVVPVTMSEAFAAKFKRVHLRLVPGGHWTERQRPWILSRAFEWLRALPPDLGPS